MAQLAATIDAMALGRLMRHLPLRDFPLMECASHHFLVVSRQPAQMRSGSGSTAGTLRSGARAQDCRVV